MPIFTLTTDLGLKDYYLASVKATILACCPEAKIIDISHQVSKFDIQQAAFILGNVYRDFPDETIHLIGVLPEKTKECPYVIVSAQKQFFIGADNGIFSLIPGLSPEKIFEIKSDSEPGTFPLKDVFIKAACHIASGKSVEEIAKIKKSVNQRTGFYPVVNENTIRGSVIYIDDFGNLVINISRDTFEALGRDRKFNITIRSGRYIIKKISKSYQSVPPGEMLALFSRSGYLEIALNAGNAYKLLGIQLNDIVLVEFFESD